MVIEDAHVGATGSARIAGGIRASGGSAWFAALGAIGAFWLVETVLVGIALVLLWMGVIHRESGPPRFEPTLLPTAFAGAFVAVRLGGWRGLLGVLAFASMPVIRYLTYPIGAAIDCSHGNVDACRAATDFDFVLPQAWLLPGFAAGGLAAVITRARVHLRVELEALGPVALVQQVMGYVLPLMRGFPGPSAFDIVVTVLALLAAAYILARRSSDPLHSALMVAGVLVLAAIPSITYLVWFNTDPARGLWDEWLSLAGPVVLVIATYALRARSRGADRPARVSV